MQEERENWQVDFPDSVLPKHLSLPYKRDHLLPKWK
jgi:hypothetical protein